MEFLLKFNQLSSLLEQILSNRYNENLYRIDIIQEMWF